MARKVRLNQESFLNIVTETFKGRLDFKKTIFTGVKKQVIVDCLIHGEYKTSAGSLLKGHGCKKCSNIDTAKNRAHTKDIFIKEAIETHGDRYDYSLVEYTNTHAKVPIICKLHGVFYQSPKTHIKSSGCPICKSESAKKIICGFGINDCIHHRYSKSYVVWSGMIKRCYDEKALVKRPTYKGCIVCDEWRRLSVFSKWFNENYIEGYELDKDILSGKTNKVYSTETCCFVPQRINCLLIRSNNNRGKLPIGICFEKPTNKYLVQIQNGKGRQTKIGRYDTIEESFLAYKEAKEKYIKEVAQDYYDKGLIKQNVYESLMKYEVEITD